MGWTDPSTLRYRSADYSAVLAVVTLRTPRATTMGDFRNTVGAKPKLAPTWDRTKDLTITGRVL
jgi:hypothetical protein